MSDPTRTRDDRTDPSRRPVLGRAWILLCVVLVATATASITLRVGDARRDRTRPVTIMPSATSTKLWQQHTITESSRNGHQPPHRITFHDDQLRVSSAESDSDGNRREIWTTGHDVGDVDVIARIDQPSSLGGAFKPQPGIALRYRDEGDGRGRALVIDANIWTQNFDRLMVGLWSWPSAGPTKVRIAPIGPAIRLDERQAEITGVLRNAGDPATDVYLVGRSMDLTSPFAFARGDHVDIRTAIDKSFEHTDAVVDVVDPKAGLITVRHPGVRAAKAAATDTGSIRFHWDPKNAPTRSLYPRYIRARIIGSTLQVKSWLVDEPEPGWQFSAVIPESLGVPASGKIGLVANHLWGAGRYLAFGDVTITPLRAP